MNKKLLLRPRTPPQRIREARVKDMEAMIGLLWALFTLEPDFTFDAEKQRQGLLQLILQERGKAVFVAEAGMRLVGMGTVQTVISTAEGGPVGWVEDVVVDPAYRGQGVGRRLLAAVEKWAQTQGLKRLQLLADRDNVGAGKFYTKQGWSPTRMVAMRKFLRPKAAEHE